MQIQSECSLVHRRDQRRMFSCKFCLNCTCKTSNREMFHFPSAFCFCVFVGVGRISSITAAVVLKFNRQLFPQILGSLHAKDFVYVQHGISLGERRIAFLTFLVWGGGVDWCFKLCIILQALSTLKNTFFMFSILKKFQEKPHRCENHSFMKMPIDIWRI